MTCAIEVRVVSGSSRLALPRHSHGQGRAARSSIEGQGSREERRAVNAECRP